MPFVSVRCLPALSGASKDEVDSVLWSLRPVIAYDPVKEMVVSVRFAQEVDKGELGLQPTPLDNISSRSSRLAEELEPDGLGEI